MLGTSNISGIVSGFVDENRRGNDDGTTCAAAMSS